MNEFNYLDKLSSQYMNDMSVFTQMKYKLGPDSCYKKQHVSNKFKYETLKLEREFMECIINIKTE